MSARRPQKSCHVGLATVTHTRRMYGPVIRLPSPMRKWLIANGEQIGMVVESYALEVSIVGGNSRGGAGA